MEEQKKIYKSKATLCENYFGVNKIDIKSKINALIKKNESFDNVVLLTDNKGSMLSFELLSDMLDTALSESFNEQNAKKPISYEQYFFYNVPQKYFYKDKIHIKHTKTYELLERIECKKSLILIYSDAGAARGGNSDGRFKPTLRFLLHLKKAAHQVVWLNPLPKERWNKTTAKRISRFVDMFSLVGQKIGNTEIGNRESNSINQTERMITYFAKKGRFYEGFLKLFIQSNLINFKTKDLYDFYVLYREQYKEELSYLVISDLIMSSLCQPIGTDLFKIDNDTREYLHTLI